MLGAKLRMGICAALSMVISGTASQAQSLEEALSLAYWNNPTLRAERSALAAIDNGVAEALSGWRPSVSITGGQSRVHTLSHDNDEARFTSTLTQRQAGLTLTQRIADFGKTSGAVRAAEARVLSGRSTLAATEQTVLLGTTEAYLDVVRGERLQELNRANVEVLTRQLAAAEAGFERQMNTRTDVAQAEARLSNAQANLRQAEEQLEVARGLYRSFVGEAPERVDFPASAPEMPPRREDIIQVALAGKPEVTAAQYAVEAAAADVDSAEAAILPTISLQGQDLYATHPTILQSDQRTTGVGVTMTVPLYQSGADYARIRARKQTLAQQRQLLDAARRAAEQEALTAWNSLQAARARIRSFETSVRANQVAYDGVVAEYQRSGTRTMLDVLNAEQELFEARANLIGARRDEVLATFRTQSAMGRMTAEALALAVVRYDPKAHYDRVRDAWFGFGDEGAGEPPR